MANQEQDQETRLQQLATLVFEMTRDVKHLLDHHPELGPSQMGGQTALPTARQRADELHTTLIETQKLFGVDHLQSRDGETP
jgi:hypothetical protein